MTEYIKKADVKSIECIESGYDDNQPYLVWEVYLKNGTNFSVENWTDNFRTAADIEDGIITDDVIMITNHALELLDDEENGGLKFL